MLAVAASTRTALRVEPREERGSRPSRRLRRSGYVPGVVYGIDGGSTPFKVDARRLRAVLSEGHALFDVEVDGGQPQPVIVKEQQREPVKGQIVHLDLLKVRLDEKIQSMVPLELDGAEAAPGVKEGGVLEHVTREVLIEALPTDIPDRIVADVSALGVAETMTLSSVAAPAGVEFVGEVEEIVVATVTVPSEVVEEPEVEEEAALVGEEGEVPAEQAAAEAEAESPPAEGEGEAPAEGG
jgi:large subunit ribosomal protein L25